MNLELIVAIVTTAAIAIWFYRAMKKNAQGKVEGLKDENRLDNDEQTSQPVSLNIEEILKMEDQTSAIIALDTYVNQLSDYGENISKLTEPQKTLLFVENLEREVNNGGFNQFYWNASGNFAHETLDGLKTIKAKKMADILEKANAVWPDQQVPRDITERQELHEEIEEQADPVWEACDNEFYTYPDNIAGLLLDYVRENKSSFK